MDSRPDAPASVAFGRFLVSPHRRELLADGQAIPLGGRAFDVLMTLIEARGAIVSKDALMARVWPDRAVAENNLQSQIVALRRAFGAERDLVRTVSGRGYQFTGEVSTGPAGAERDVTSPVAETQTLPPTNVPAPVSELIGRDDALHQVLSLAAAHRLVTLTGTGGIGKTRLALAAARRRLLEFADGVWLVEFAPLADPALVPATVGGVFGLEFPAGAVSAENIAKALSPKRLLLVLDNCEHVIEAAAQMAEALLRASSTTHVVATSREPLKIEGEWIHTVPPLAMPAEGAESEDDPILYGAVRLFVERVRAAEPHFAPDRPLAATIAAICRRLDGIPLAIELAAARAAALGIEELFGSLDHLFNLLTGGRRTALPRHQTLRATLDWSYELLLEPERTTLRRLAIFAGAFGLEAATAVAASTEIAPREVVDSLSNLVAKSLVAAEVEGTVARYRLLETTRAFALEKLVESGEHGRVARRLAEYGRDLLEAAEFRFEQRPSREQAANYRLIENLRTALDWAFSPAGDASLGVALTAAAVPLWMHLSLLEECRERAERALASIDNREAVSARAQMRLADALASSLFHTRGAVREAEVAWTTALDIAECLDVTDYQLRALWGLWSHSISAGSYPRADQLARRFHEVAKRGNDVGDLLIAERMIGGALHFLGDQVSARRHIETMLSQYDESLHRPHIVRFHYDQRLAAQVTLARILWAQGFPEQAMHAAATAIEEAQASQHPISLGFATNEAAIPVMLFVGDFRSAERHIAALLKVTEQHALTVLHARAVGAMGVLASKRGDPHEGVRLIRDALHELDKGGYHAYPLLLGSLAEALGEVGNVEEGLASVESALSRCERNGERWYIADLLRIKGELNLRLSDPEASVRAETEFRSSLDWARRQGALSWELRAATSLARLMRDQGRSADALALLQPIYDRFTEGFDTADLKTAKALLDGLHGPAISRDRRRSR